MIKIIEFQGEKEILVKLIEELQDYLIQIDPLKRLRRLPEYGEIYINNLLDKIHKNNGIIYVAELDNVPIGMIAGIFDSWSKEDELETIPSKPARILELIVNENYRGQNIGSLLMGETEKYFKAQGADIIRVEVFEPNQSTHAFYKKLGYNDRAIDMVKILS